MIRRVVRRALRRRPSLSVVVVLGPRQARHLADCLESLPAGADVLVAPWGVDDAPLSVARDARVLPRSVTGNEARNAGVAAAQRDTVLMLEATQRADRAGVERLVASLTGASQPVVAGRGSAADLARVLWRRESVPTFDPAHGRFPQAALVEAAEVDARVIAHDEGPWATPFGTVPPVADELDAFARLVADRPDAPWLGDLLATVGGAFLDDQEHASPEAVGAFAEALRKVPGAALAQVGVEDRLRLWLVAQGRHAAMSRLTVDRWFTRGQFPTRVEDGLVLADLPVPDVDVPASVLAVPVRLGASLRRAVPVAGGWQLTVFASARWVDLATHPPTVTVRAVHGSGHAVELPVSPAPDAAATRHVGTSHQNHDAGAVRVDLAAAALDRPGRWRVEVTLDVAGLSLTGPLTDRDDRSSAGVLAAPADAGARLAWDAADGLLVEAGADASPAAAPGAPYARSVEVGDDLVVRVGGGSPAGLDLCLGPRRLPATIGHDPDGSLVARFPLVVDDWGLGARPLPAGTWHVRTSAGGELTLGPDLVARSPLELDAPDHRARLLRGLRGQLLLQLQPPLADDELGPWAQQRLRSSYAASDRPVDPGQVLFSSYAGTGATDSPRAIYEELRARRPGLRQRWVVADRSVAAPVGAETVLLRSREWYDALATAGTVVSNVEMDRFFRTRPGQRLLQTFHGYPSKAMGISMWQAKGLSPRMIAGELRRTASDWDLILTPAPEMDQHYRREYAYDGPILSHGYPRDDVFLGDRAGPLRRRTRELLGVEPGQTVVLYAPTWRDDLAARFGSSHLVQHLDLEQAAQALGDDHVLLMRGHRYHQPASSPSSSPGIIDVTTYPEINDLLLAADVAVLDYSSIRFDFALTGRPMVFLVPDLEQYTTGSRGFLYPFEDSAPGPLLDSAAEVVEALRDLDTLRRDHAADYERFNATYNHRQDGRSAERVVRAFFGPA